MATLVVTCGGCGVRLRASRPEVPRAGHCPRCGMPLDLAAIRAQDSPETFDLRLEGLELSDPYSEESRPAWGRLRGGMVLALVALGLSVGLRLGSGGDARSPYPSDPPKVPPAPAVQPIAPSRTEVPPPEPERPETARERAADRPSPTNEPSPPSPSHRPNPIPSLIRSSPFGPLAVRRTPLVIPSGTPLLPPTPSEAHPPGPQTPGAPPPRSSSAPPPPPLDITGEPRRIKVRMPNGDRVVARVHGLIDGKVSVILPDGQLALASGLADTDEPFRPEPADRIRDELRAGPFANFQVLQSPHYLILYRSTPRFAEASLKLLEDLYKNLSEALRKRDIPVHEAEFPLVAIIFRTERDFRAYQPVARDVQAYYEIFTNRIYFYQKSDRDQEAPEFAALRRPQTVAHEGTHQILQNIGIQPRLSDWPLWLVEGLAEYCSPPTSTRSGAAWGGLGRVNAMHMATIRDLEDAPSLEGRGGNAPQHIGRDPRMPLVEYLVTRTELTPTDYALAWSMTHYLAQKRSQDFLNFLKVMSRTPPLQRRTPADHLAAFRAAFGPDLARMDKAIAIHLSKLRYDPLPYYAVLFEQRVGDGMIKRATIVSQSPSMIRQWLETVRSPQGDEPSWQTLPRPTKARALLAAEEWIRAH